ncbi:ABC transporter permease subunit [Bradyrhizobium sp. CW9]|uniref:ABC transporter permease n=1 Tax=Bradyrhizobium sp. CW9 TaxID=2782689 RepID=UPI001FF7E963|nr:ABC transporter permease subunit [Bradyrhizobium sp. CW9]
MLKLGLIGTKAGIVLTHTIGAISYVVVIVSATLVNFDRQLERAAKSMRAGPLQTFTRVTLPLIRPGVIGGALFAFIHSFDEVVKSSLVSGLSIRTLPLKMWENIQHEIDPTIAAVASLLVLYLCSGWSPFTSHGGARSRQFEARSWRASPESTALHIIGCGGGQARRSLSPSIFDAR